MDMQIKTTLKFHLTHVRMVKKRKKKKEEGGGGGKDVGQRWGTLIHCWLEFKLVQPL
jgi:hypothetical protein